LFVVVIVYYELKMDVPREGGSDCDVCGCVCTYYMA
jgi:hypothetical protein